VAQDKHTFAENPWAFFWVFAGGGSSLPMLSRLVPTMPAGFAVSSGCSTHPCRVSGVYASHHNTLDRQQRIQAAAGKSVAGTS
jgi:hypothetical protein